MDLRPIAEEVVVVYPSRRARFFNAFGRWVRRVGVAVALTSSAAVWSGCISEGGVAGPEPDYFVACDDNDPEPAPDFQYPGTFSRYLCPGQSTFAELTLEDQRTLSFELSATSYNGVSTIQAVIVDPEGDVAGVLDDGQPFLELSLAPGTWRITVTQLSSTDEGNFALDIDDEPTFSEDSGA